jgi:hypothetical protein
MELSREEISRLLEIANSEPVDADRRLFARAITALINEFQRREEAAREPVAISPAEFSAAAEVN